MSLLFNSCEPNEEPETNDPRDQVTGVWSCNETGNEFGNQHYEVQISKSSNDSTKILLGNFYQVGQVYAKQNDRSITIPSQKVDEYTISGSGSISSNYKTINLTYTVKVGTSVDNVTAVYSK